LVAGLGAGLTGEFTGELAGLGALLGKGWTGAAGLGGAKSFCFELVSSSFGVS
jgi:hypothetical protein